MRSVQKQELSKKVVHFLKNFHLFETFNSLSEEFANDYVRKSLKLIEKYSVNKFQFKNYLKNKFII